MPAYVLFVVCLRLGNWDDLVEGKLEKVFVMHLGWGQRVKVEPSRFPGIDLRVLDLRSSMSLVGLPLNLLVTLEGKPTT